MSLAAHIPPAEQLSAILAGFAVFFAVVAVSWPYIFRDTLGERMR